MHTTIVISRAWKLLQCPICTLLYCYNNVYTYSIYYIIMFVRNNLQYIIICCVSPCKNYGNTSILVLQRLQSIWARTNGYIIIIIIIIKTPSHCVHLTYILFSEIQSKHMNILYVYISRYLRKNWFPYNTLFRAPYSLVIL